jgi:uncharacterized membrane protein YphA (DoxX/SURF4 family)
MKKEKTISILLVVSRVVLGLVFIFSGFMKGVDPLGSAYKFSDYFNAFDIGFLEPLALVLSFFMSAAEFLIGISLLFGFRFRTGTWAVTIFMGFFTLLTLVLALTNPVTDCGCFGDAIIMTNWQTFFKNLVLLPFVFTVFYFRRKHAEPSPRYLSLAGLLLFAALFLALEFHSYRHLPLKDFRPYSIGTRIRDKMIVPEGEPLDEYQTLLYYEKNGEVKEFTEENFPWQDSTWKYVDTKNKLVSKGYEPPIHDFTVVDEFGYDHVNNILADPGYSFLLVSPHFDKADREALVLADALATWCLASGHSFYCLTSSPEDEIEKVREDLGLGFGIYTTDEIALKTIIRSNPGLLLLKEGTILGKWHYHDLPSPEALKAGPLPFIMTQYRKGIEGRGLAIFTGLFLILAVILLFTSYSKKPGR